MGATQGCSSIEKGHSCTVLQPTRPASTIEHAPVKDSKTDVAAVRHRTIISLWAKCKNAVRELSRFQKFLRRRYSTPNESFVQIFKECERHDGAIGGYVTREDFMHHVEKAGFRGDSGALFVMLKDGAGDFVTRHSFLQRLKVRSNGNERGDKFFAVVKQAVTTATLVDKGVEEESERFEAVRMHSWRSPRENGTKKRVSFSPRENGTKKRVSFEKRASKDRSRSPNVRTQGR